MHCLKRASVGLFALAVSLGAATGPAGATHGNPGNSKDCTDFATWNEAQVWYETYFDEYGDVGRLDSNDDRVPCESLPGAPAQTQSPSKDGGYLMLESNGTVFGFGDVRPLLPAIHEPAVSISMTPSGGYWVLGRNGVVHTRGVQHHGNAQVPAGDRPTSISGLADGTGYWVFTDKGRALAFGSAAPYGDMSGTPLNGGIIASVATTTGKGYWMVGSDGGIFTFGDAKFYGSTGDMRLNEPVVGMAPDPDGVGYWLVASDGGMFSFDAPFRGSVPEVLQPGQRLNKPVAGAIAYGDGYLMVAADGGIFSFSNRPFFGSLGSSPTPNPVIGVAVR
jgi:hypothetical protein